MPSVRPAILALTLVGLAMGSGIGTGELRAQQRSVQGATAGAERGWLGLSLREFVASTGTPGATSGVRLVVTDLFRNGPAQSGGLRPGDVLVRLNGAPADMGRFRSVAERLLPGDPLTLTVLRDGRLLDLAVEAGLAPRREEIVRQVVQVHLDSARIAFAPRLDSLHTALESLELRESMLRAVPRVHVSRIDGDTLRTLVVLTRADGSTVTLDDGRGARGSLVLTRPEAGPDRPGTGAAFLFRRESRDSVLLRRAPEPETAEWRPLTPYVAGANRVAGAEFRALDAGLGTYFGVDRGVLVLDVAEGTPARRAGLDAGDVIVGANGGAVYDVANFRALLARSPGPISLDVVRRGRAVSLVLPR
jgi:membrane-associated protease RseP (regulator of RpoE activity)